MNLSSGSFAEQYDDLPRGPFNSYARSGQQDEQDSGAPLGYDVDPVTGDVTSQVLIPRNAIEYMARLARQQKEMEAEERALLFELTQFGFDIGGIFDPYPTCDLISAGMSLMKGEVGLAFISVVAVIPLFDWVKLGKIAKLSKVVDRAIEYGKKSPEAAARVRPWLEALSHAIEKASKVLPESARTALAPIQEKIDNFLAPAGNGGNGGFSGHRGFELGNHPLQPVRNSATTIGQRQFSGHALDQMQNRGIPPSVVENTIQHGIPFPDNRPGTQGFYDPLNRVRVIINSDNGTVLTVMHGGG